MDEWREVQRCTYELMEHQVDHVAERGVRPPPPWVLGCSICRVSLGRYYVSLDHKARAIRDGSAGYWDHDEGFMRRHLVQAHSAALPDLDLTGCSVCAMWSGDAGQDVPPWEALLILEHRADHAFRMRC